jgi:hypothetical protein
MSGSTPTGRLAQFFPDATPVRIPVRITRTDLPVEEVTAQGTSEQTIIEFGTPREVIFAAHMPLEFAAQLRVVNLDGSLDAGASVVAMQLDDGSMAIAARFDHEVANWIVKPVS